MIFQHTLDNVLNGKKTQTSRIWKDNYVYWHSETILPDAIRSANTGNLIYQVGKTYAVQPGRGMKAVARIRILELSWRDVRTFTDDELMCEAVSKSDWLPISSGRARFKERPMFLKLWEDMRRMFCATDARC